MASTARLHCTHCDNVFDAPGSGRPRCPRCMRTHGLEPAAGSARGGAASASGGARAKRPGLVAAIVVGLALVVGVAAWYLSRGARAGGPSGGIGLSPEDITARLAAAGATPDLQVVPFAGGAATRTLFAAAMTGGGDAATTAKALAAALEGLRTAGKWRVASPYRTVVRAPETAEALAAKLGAASGLALYPYEAAVLLLAAAREAGIGPVRVAEAYALPGRPSPDPSGTRGHYVLLVGEPAALFIDPTTGGAGNPAEATLRALDDVQAVTPYLVLRALHLLGSATDAPGANRAVELAFKLDPASPSLLCTRAAVYAAGGGLLEAIAEMERAVATRPDAVRHLALAEILLASAREPGALERAKSELGQALSLDPNLPTAHALQATIFMLENDLDHARGSLEKAMAGGIDGPRLALLKSRLAVESGDAAGGVRVLEDEIARGESVDELTLALIDTLIRAGRVADAQEAAKKLLATSKHADMIRPLLTELLAGPSSMPAGDAMGAAGAGLMGVGPGLGAEPPAPSLLGDEKPGLLRPPSGRPSLLGGDRLKLDLGASPPSAGE